MMFFASWLTQTTPLAQELSALNSCAAVARAHGWPALSAVDEAPTEPRPTSLATMLRHLGAPLTYLVAVEATGRLADGYGVQGLPWFLLTSQSGRVLWHHSGLLPLAQLEARVARYAPGA
ncbi:MAG: hypothetical protein M0Z54_06560 [Thermaerobacter sp.]|nr:hypothetical protein [Thermaerobacter sp.]